MTQNITNNLSLNKVVQNVWVVGGGGATSSLTPVDIPGSSVTITPTSSSNNILVWANIPGGSLGLTSQNSSTFFQVLRGSTVLGGTPYGQTSTTIPTGNSWWLGGIPFFYLDSPATTSATTYKIQYYVSNNFGAAGTASNVTIVLMEVIP